MGYIVPSALVYQQLASSGGVANVTPDLDTAIIGPCYNVIEYDGTSASALITSAAVDDQGNAFRITDNEINNAVNLPGQKPGQDVEESSVEVYLNNCVVETLSTKFTGTVGDSLLEVVEAVGAGDASANSNEITDVVGIEDFAEGDAVVVAGAGAAGADLSAVITDIDVAATKIFLSSDALTTAAGAVITKSEISNTNAVTATRRVEAGDAAVLTYTASGVIKTFTSTVMRVESLTGVINTLSLSDMLPADIAGNVLVSIRKKYNNQRLLKEIDGYTNFDDSTVGADGVITIRPLPKLAYGNVVAADVHVAYRALRNDLSGAIIDVENVTDLEGKLGKPSDRNPLALGVQIALANTIGRILAIATPGEGLAGFQAGLDLAEGRRIYSLVPLTQDVEVIGLFRQHVDQMSTPELASWRVAIVNTDIPKTKAVGTYNADNVNANGGNNVIKLVNGKYVLESSNAEFLSDGVVPGDIVHVTDGTGTIDPKGKIQVLQVLNNQQLQVAAGGTATAVSYYVTRNLTKAQQAEVVVGTSRTLGINRVIHIPQGAGVTINGVTKYLPGYYLACAVSGLISGLPVQQSLTNIGLAGIADVQFGNFYFTRAQMDNMAAAGTCHIVQESQGAIPYVRHSLTTDMTVLYFRELQQVKNWDYLSYFFKDLIQGFVGRYNITPDTLNILRQTLTAGGRLLQGKKLAKLGPPLLDFNIKSIRQSDTNRDTVIVEMPISMPTVLNYINLYLIV